MNSHPESPKSGDNGSRNDPHIPPTGQNCGERILLTAQTLLYHTYTVTIFKIEGGWSTHGNEESSEEASQEGGQEEVVIAP